MKPNKRFQKLPKSFWANIRFISQKVGYTNRGKGSIKIPSFEEIKSVFIKFNLDSGQICNSKTDNPSELGKLIISYFDYRAEILHKNVEPNLMNFSQARKVFTELRKKLKPSCPIPLNKQKGKKKAPAYFTSIVNMLIEANIGDCPCDYDPRSSTIITHKGLPLRTLSRRIDGALPSPVNPIAIWEIKEYYYTTTFGSRVADAIYETLMDGMELEELRTNENIKVEHYLMVDDYFTWWKCGRSYLCRLIDLLHMGYIDEVLFGREVLTRVPKLAGEWKNLYKNRKTR